MRQENVYDMAGSIVAVNDKCLFKGFDFKIVTVFGGRVRIERINPDGERISIEVPTDSIFVVDGDR